MKLHEREMPVSKARCLISIKLNEMCESHNIEVDDYIVMLSKERIRIATEKGEVDDRLKPIIEIRDEHELTDCEYLQALNSDEATTLKYCLRAERHPDEPDKPSGIA